MFVSLFSKTQNVQKNLDNEVKLSSLQELKYQVSQQNGCFTIYGLLDAWKQKDTEKMDFIKEKMTNTANFNYMVDISLEEGNDKMTKYLINSGARPSLYAKQMAEVNGHTKLAKFVETFYPLRNDVSIASVHCRIRNGTRNWDSCIPEEFRFI